MKAVIFDLGKVLVGFDYSNAVRQLVERGDNGPETVARLLLQGPLLNDYELGRISTADFFKQVKALSGFQGDYAEFEAIFGGIFWPIEPMIQMHAGLRQHQIPTYIFSNTSEMVVGYLRRHMAFFREFDGYVLSFEQGLLKPDPGIYAVVEAVAGRKADQLIYIDDRPENIQTALERGWRAILHADPMATRQQVAEWLSVP